MNPCRRDGDGIVEALGCRSLGIKADVANKDRVDAMFEEALTKFGHVDILASTMPAAP